MSILWKNTELEVISESDVAVFGAGPGGLGAAVMAARAKCSVAIFEQAGRPGGAAALAEVSPFMYSADSKGYLDGPVYTEWFDRMLAYLPPSMQKKQREMEFGLCSKRTVSPTFVSLAAEDLLLEAGCKPWYHCRLVDVVMSEDRHNIAAAVIHGKGGFAAVVAKRYIDATGDGDLAALAGAPFEMGADDTPESCQPMTTCFDLDNVELPYGTIRCEEFYVCARDLFPKAKEEGKISSPRESLLCFDAFGPNSVHFNTTRIIEKDATDTASLSEAEIEGRRQLREYLVWLRAEFPGFKEANLRSFGDVGIRESRRIKGLARITGDDVKATRHYPDGIACCNYSIDVHNPHGNGTVHYHLEPNTYYEIPYGCIIPQGVDNMAVASRCISSDQMANSSCRVMPPVCSLGQAAGVAAALSIQSGTPLPQLDGKLVRKALIEAGANLDRK
ncbi:MAG: FAD-dependent oxidoreductase [Victivallales bacterium]|nr:FAD-dependent oxidoreductase [Victivallales bacterium]